MHQQKRKEISKTRQLINTRNEVLIYRYVFWHHVKRLRTDDVYDTLSTKEIFLEEITIRRIIRANVEKILEIKKQGINTRKMQERFPSFNWKAN